MLWVASGNSYSLISLKLARLYLDILVESYLSSPKDLYIKIQTNIVILATIL